MATLYSTDTTETIANKESSKSTLGVFLGDVFLGYLSEIPKLNFSNTYQTGAPKRLTDGLLDVSFGLLQTLQSVTNGVASLLPHATNLKIAQTAKQVTEELPKIATGHLKMQGLSLNGGVMSRKYFQISGDYLEYQFDIICPSSQMIIANNALKKHVLPSQHSGKGMKALSDMIALLSHPSALINKQGDIGYDGSPLQGLVKTMSTEFGKITAPSAKNKYLNDDFKGSEDTILKTLERNTNLESGTTGEDERKARLAKFIAKATTSDESIENRIGNFSTSGLKTLGSITKKDNSPYSGMRSFLEGVEGDFKSDDKGYKGNIPLLQSVGLGVGSLADTVLDVASIPSSLYLDILDKSLVVAPQKIGLGAISIKKVGQGVDSNGVPIVLDSKNLWENIVPKPVLDGSFMNAGLKLCVTSYTVTPDDNINRNGIPLTHKISLRVSVSQKLLSSNLKFNPNYSSSK